MGAICHKIKQVNSVRNNKWHMSSMTGSDLRWKHDVLSVQHGCEGVNCLLVDDYEILLAGHVFKQSLAEWVKVPDIGGYNLISLSKKGFWHD